MKKEEKRARMMQKAHELAASGRHVDYVGIEIALTKEGYLEAREWLDRPSIREDLKRECDLARKGISDASRT